MLSLKGTGSYEISRGRTFAPQFINYHQNLYTQMLYPLRCYRSPIPAVWGLLVICEGLGQSITDLNGS